MRVLLALLLAAGLASCDATDPPPADETTDITLLVAYTPGVAALADAEDRIRRGIDETNAVYSASHTGARLVPVHFVRVADEVADRVEALGQFLAPADGVYDDLHTLRDRYEADVVLLVSSVPGTTINGAILATEATAVLIVQVDVIGAPGYGLAHEMGHLHGARHAPDEDTTSVPFAYGHAFRNDTLRTVLAGGSQRKVPAFAGPDVVVEGVVMGDAVRSDAARVVRESAAFLSNFRGPQTPTPFVPPGTWPTLP
jgi:hypothetical protein